jgi:hypothetical protein
MKELAVSAVAAKRAKWEKEGKDRNFEADIGSVVEKIEDSSSEEEQEFVISDNDEPDFDQYRPYP